MAVVGEKALEIYFKASRVGLFKSDGFKKRFISDLTYVYSVMYARKVDKIERASAHNKECFKIFEILAGRDVVNEPALVGELELRDPCKLAVGISGVREQIGIEFYSASIAEHLLFFL